MTIRIQKSQKIFLQEALGALKQQTGSGQLAADLPATFAEFGRPHPAADDLETAAAYARYTFGIIAGTGLMVCGVMRPAPNVAAHMPTEEVFQRATDVPYKDASNDVKNAFFLRHMEAVCRFAVVVHYVKQGVLSPSSLSPDNIQRECTDINQDDPRQIGIAHALSQLSRQQILKSGPLLGQTGKEMAHKIDRASRPGGASRRYEQNKPN